MGPISDEHALLSDASWNEKSAAILLIVGIVVVGIAPFWLIDLIQPGTEFIMSKLGAVALVK
jgi:NADH-quinone oxidoreductase subunit M